MSDSTSSTWARLFWLAGGVSALLAIFIFATGWGSIRIMFREIGIDFSRGRYEILRDKPEIVELKNPDFTTITRLNTDAGPSFVYATREKSLMHPRQFLRLECQSDIQCKGFPLVDIPDSIEYIDSAFVDRASGDIVVLDRRGRGLYINSNRGVYAPFSVALSCSENEGFFGAGTEGGGFYVVRVGHLRRRSLNLWVNSGWCTGVQIGASSIPSTYTSIGPYQELYFNLKFDELGRLASGSAEVTKASGGIPDWFSLKSDRRDVMEEYEFNDFVRGRNQKNQIIARRREKLISILSKYPEHHILVGDAIPRETYNKITVAAGLLPGQLVAVMDGTDKVDESNGIFFTTEGILSARIGVLTPIVPYNRLRQITPRKGFFVVFYGAVELYAVGLDKNAIIWIVSEVSQAADWE